MAKVVGLFVYRVEGTAPEVRDSVEVGRSGIRGDRHARHRVRAILVADAGTHSELGLLPGSLREQITVEGLPEINSMSPGDLLRLGEGLFEVTKRCAPCKLIGEYNNAPDAETFRLALEGRRGVFVRPAAGHFGTKISIGDEAAQA